MDWEYLNKQKKKKTQNRKWHRKNMQEYEMELARERYEKSYGEEIHNYRRKIG